MSRLMRWLGVCALIAIPILLAVVPESGSCGDQPACPDPIQVGRPGWAWLAVIGLVLVGLGLLVASVLVDLDKR